MFRKVKSVVVFFKILVTLVLSRPFGKVFVKKFNSLGYSTPPTSGIHWFQWNTFFCRKRMQARGDKNQKCCIEKTDKEVKNKKIGDNQVQHLKSKAENQQLGLPDNNKNNRQEVRQTSDYFRNCRGSTMTVVFHAVLSPHFKFDPDQGDKIFMRFGGAVFGEFCDDVVEVHPER